MAFRKIKAKKYNGIFEYYSDRDKDKTTRGYYLSYRDEFKKSTMKRLEANTREDALKEANALKQTALDKLNEYKSDKRKLDTAIKNKSLTLDDYASMFFDNRKTKNNSRDTSTYKRRISPSLGKDKLARITTEDVSELQEFLETLSLAPKTINETINLLSVMFNSAIRKGMMASNPISRDESDEDNYIAKLEVSTEVGRGFDESELSMLFDTLKDGNEALELAPHPRLFLFTKLLYYTGARPDAILTLKVSDYDKSGHTIRIKAMKLARDYKQPLNKEVEVLLVKWIEDNELGYDDAIFYSKQSYDRAINAKARDIAKQTSTGYEAMRKTGRRYFDELFNKGLPVHAKLRRAGFYSLRRAGATKIYHIKGLAHASKFLHHSDIKTTMRYLAIDDDLEASVNVL